MQSAPQSVVSIVTSSSARRPLARALRAVALAAVLVCGGAACETKNLHPAHGLRFHEMMSAQQASRGTHDPVARGDEATLAIQAYYLKLSGNDQGGGGGVGGGMGQPQTTAGVKPLVR